ncbi:MAG TPA: hypothetical protein VNO21_25040 [Polyangiaceae bacterium]|nr:hypothetical protein [Polyangiaceae bacterium]
MALLAAVAATLSACTHDFDAFKPRPDASADGAAQTQAWEPSDDDLAPAAQESQELRR